MSKTRPWLAAGIAACALALHAPSAVHAQCDPDLFADKANDPFFFWNELDCSARDGLSDTLGALTQKVVLAGYKTILNMYVKGLGDAVTGVLDQVMKSDSGKDVFGPSNMDLMYAIQSGTNRVISALNQNANGSDLNRAQAIQASYLQYQQDPTFYTRVVKAQAELSQNVLWYETLGSLSLSRHGPLALHAAMSMTEVYARRMMDLELASEVLARKPGAPSYKDYLENLPNDEREDVAKVASRRALLDMKVMFNGGRLPTGDNVSGFFSDVARFANGEFRVYSDRRFSDITFVGTHNDFCGTNFGRIDTMEASYHFPLDPNNPAANPSTPKFKAKIFWDACQRSAPGKDTVEWTLEVRNSKNEVIFTAKYGVPVRDGSTYNIDDQFVTAEPERILKQAAYERFLSISYGALRPKLDAWWKIVGNPGYPAWKADAELDKLIMESRVVRETVEQLAAMAPEWSEGINGSHLRLVLDYVLTFGSGGLEELTEAPKADRLGWNTGNGKVVASDYLSFVGALADPGEATQHYKDQMVAKIITVIR